MKDNLKKLEQEAENMQASLDEMKSKIAEMKQGRLKFQKGKFYKGRSSIVLCTSPLGIDEDYFTGIDVLIGRNFGKTGHDWIKGSFKEVTPTWEEVR